MTLEVHTVELRAVDHASQTFRQFGNEGQKAAKNVEQSFDKASESQKRFSVSSAAVGAALGTGIGLMGDWARAAAEDQAGQERLQQSIENTGKSYSDYSQQIEKAIAVGQKRAFSDDQVRDSLVQMTNATHDAGKSLADLSLAEDLARARKIDLAAATQIVVNAEEHRYGALARMGIVLDKNATSEEALAAIQQTVAGQADVYAKSNLGWMEQQKIKVDELTESWGYALGPLQQITTLLPGLSAGFTGISGALAGMGGISGLAGLAPLLAQGAGIGALGTIAYGYSQNDVGTTFANELANKIFIVMGSLINAAFPGANPIDVSKYTDQMAKNATWDQINAVFGSPSAAGSALGVIGSPGAPLGSSIGYGGAVDPNTGQPIGYQIPGGAIEGPVPSQPPTDAQIYDAINANAAALGLTVAQYLALPSVKRAGIIARATSGQGNVYDTGSAPLASQGVTDRAYPGSGFPDWIGLRPGTSRAAMYGEGAGSAASSAGGSGAVANGLVTAGPLKLTDDQQTAQRHIANAKAIGEENAAYLDLVNGVNTASAAQAAFKATQDRILQSEGRYSAQISEYSGQVSAITAAHDLLNKKVEEGVPLTKAEQEFQDNYNKALERGTGAVDDATISQGLLAEKYLLNMDNGDKINDSLKTQSGTVDELTKTVQMLILAMDGVPSEVKTQILLDMSQADPKNLELYTAYLNSIPSNIRTTITTVYVTSGTPAGGGAGGAGLNYNQLGGVIPAAAHGRYIGGPYTLVGEDGPEILTGGQGGMVIPASATRAKRQSMGGGGTVIHNMTVIANDPAQFARQMRSQSVTGSRR